MRTLLFASLVVSVPAFGASVCPFLAGSFTCEVSSTLKEAKLVTQAAKGAATVYRINDFEIVTDNMVRNVPDNAELMQANIRAWCHDGKVHTQLMGKSYNAKGYLGELTSNSEWYPTPSGIARYTHGNIRMTDGTLYPFDDAMTCIRN